MKKIILDALILVGKPVLLIDNVEELIPGVKITASKNISMNDNLFLGSKISDRFLPGNYLLESLTQAGHILILTHDDVENAKVILSGIESVKYHKAINVGDKIVLIGEAYKIRSTSAVIKVFAYVEGELVCEGYLNYSISQNDMFE